MLSRHGISLSFDASASGYGRSDGCVVLMLERMKPGKIYMSENVTVGSIKASIGHGEAAAGATALLKLALMLQNNYIPPLVNFHVTNSKMDMGSLVLPAVGEERILVNCGMTSFGVSGTNAAAMVRRSRGISPNLNALRKHYFVPISAKNMESLNMMLGEVKSFLPNSNENMEDITAAFAFHKNHYSHRCAFIVDRRGRETHKSFGTCHKKMKTVALILSDADVSYDMLHVPSFAKHFDLLHCERSLPDEDKLVICFIRLAAETFGSTEVFAQTGRELTLALMAFSFLPINPVSVDLLQMGSLPELVEKLEKLGITSLNNVILERYINTTHPCMQDSSVFKVHCDRTSVMTRYNFLVTLSDLYVNGFDLDFSCLYTKPLRYVHIPTYSFNRRAIWFMEKPPVFDHYLLGMVQRETEASVVFQNWLDNLRHPHLFTRSFVANGAIIEIAHAALTKENCDSVCIMDIRVAPLNAVSPCLLETEVKRINGYRVVSAHVNKRNFFICVAMAVDEGQMKNVSAKSDRLPTTGGAVTDMQPLLIPELESRILVTEDLRYASVGTEHNESPYFTAIEVSLKMNPVMELGSVHCISRLPRNFELQSIRSRERALVVVRSQYKTLMLVYLCAPQCRGSTAYLEKVMIPVNNSTDLLKSSTSAEDGFEEFVNAAPCNFRGYNRHISDLLSYAVGQRTAIKNHIKDRASLEMKNREVIHPRGNDADEVLPSTRGNITKKVISTSEATRSQRHNNQEDYRTSMLTDARNNELTFPHRVLDTSRSLDGLQASSSSSLLFRDNRAKKTRNANTEGFENHFSEKRTKFQETHKNHIRQNSLKCKADRILESVLNATQDVLSQQIPISEETLSMGFVDLGLDSLNMVEFVSRLNQKYFPGMSISTADIFDHPTIMQLADHIREAKAHDLMENHLTEKSPNCKLDKIQESVLHATQEVLSQQIPINHIREAKAHDLMENHLTEKSPNCMLDRIQESVLHATQEVLSQQIPISVETLSMGFVDLGLDSLNLVEFVSRLSQKYFPGMNISTADIFDYPTIMQLAEHIREKKAHDLIENHVREKLPDRKLDGILGSVLNAIQDVLSQQISTSDETLCMGFADLGLDSLNMVEFVSRLNQKYFPGMDISTADIFDYPTIMQLAAYIEEKERQSTAEKHSSSPSDSSPGSSKNTWGIAKEVQYSMARDRSHECSAYAKVFEDGDEQADILLTSWNADVLSIVNLHDGSKLRFTSESLPAPDFSRIIANGAIVKFHSEAAIQPKPLFSSLLAFANQVCSASIELRVCVSNSPTLGNALARSFFKTLAAEKYPKIQYIYTERLLRLNLSFNEPSPKIKGNWLITGGLSGIGLSIAKWLVHECSAENLVMISRRVPDKDLDAQLNELRKRTNVIVISASVADFEKLQEEFTRIPFEINGVIHSAGVVRDGAMERQTSETFSEVFTPKGDGYHAIDTLLRDNGHHLDHFIVMSSFTVVTGNVGQLNYGVSNAYLDHQMYLRRMEGKPGTTIHWGNWLDTGMAKRVQKTLTNNGFLGLTNEEALKYLRYAIIHKPNELTVAKLDWETVLKKRPDIRQDIVIEAPNRTITGVGCYERFGEQLGYELIKSHSLEKHHDHIVLEQETITEEVFREAYERCLRLADTHRRENVSLMEILDNPDKALLLQSTSVTQPIMFAFGYACAMLWQSFGFQPDYYLGHSVGELVAGVVAGIMTLEEGVLVVVERGAALEKQLIPKLDPKDTPKTPMTPLQFHQFIANSYVDGYSINWNVYNTEPLNSDTLLPSYHFNNKKYWPFEKQFACNLPASESSRKQIYYERTRLKVPQCQQRDRSLPVVNLGYRMDLGHCKYYTVAEFQLLDPSHQKRVVLYHSRSSSITEALELISLWQTLEAHSNFVLIVACECNGTSYTEWTALCRTLASERLLPYKFVSYSTDEELKSELSFEDIFECIFYEQSSRYVERLAPVTLKRAHIKQPQHLLVTGGIGGIGKRIIEFMNAKRRTVVTRSPKNGPARRDEESQTFIESNLASLSLPAGEEYDVVVHCAGVVVNALMASMNYPRFEKVCHPKSVGFATLLNSLKGRDPRLVVVASSVAAILGSRGQANYAFANGLMTSFAEMSESPTMVIHWGPWKNTGMLQGDHADIVFKQLHANGWEALEPLEALDVLNSTAKDVVVFSGNFELIAKQQEHLRKFLSKIVPLEIPSQVEESPSEHAILSPEKEEQTVEHQLEEIIARDKDNVHAVIKSYGLSNDGLHKASFMAPNSSGQKECISEALASLSSTDVDRIRYVECHGTGTLVGDEIEIESMKSVYGRGENLTIGSVKANIGHGFAASGMAGLFKVMKILQNQIIPPQINLDSPQDDIPFQINRKPKALDSSSLAAVSSFGIGGTNAHIVLGSAKTSLARSMVPNSRSTVHILPISGRSGKACIAQCRALAEYLRSRSDVDLKAVAATLQQRRDLFKYRAAFVVKSVPEAISKLEAFNSPTTAAPLDNSNICFLFAPQGVQYPNMEKASLDYADVCKKELERLVGLASKLFQKNFMEVMYPEVDQDSGLIFAAKYAQVALFIISRAIVAQLDSWGISADFLIGHSVGEYAAACYAGIVDEFSCMKLLKERGELVSTTKEARMLAVVGFHEALPDDVEVTAHLSDNMKCVVGPPGSIEALKERLSEEGIAFRELSTEHGFHSSMMDCVQRDFIRAVKKVPFREGTKKIVSNINGEIITKFDSNYCWNHMRRPVDLKKCLDTTLSESKIKVVVEIGPSGVVKHLLAERSSNVLVISTVLGRRRAPERPSHSQLLQSLADLWTLGCEVNFKKIIGSPKFDLNTPFYQFDKVTCWKERILKDSTARYFKASWSLLSNIKMKQEHRHEKKTLIISSAKQNIVIDCPICEIHLTTPSEAFAFTAEELTVYSLIIYLPETDLANVTEPFFLSRKICQLVPDRLISHVKTLTRRNQTTEFVVVLSAFIISLRRFKSKSHSNSIVIGYPVSGRNDEVKDLIGYFLNNTVLAVDIPLEDGLQDVILKVKTATTALRRFERIPFHELVAALGRHQTGGNHLFEIFFNYRHQLDFPTTDFPNVDVEIVQASMNKIFNLSITFDELPEGTRVMMEYNSSKYRTDLIQGLVKDMLGNFHNRDKIVSQPCLPRTDYPSIAITHCLNDFYSKGSRIAIRRRNSSISYQELDQQISTIARFIGDSWIKSTGSCVRSDDVITVDLASNDAVVVILAILKLGTAYAPMDKTWPESRKAQIVANLECSMSISEPLLSNISTKKQRRRGFLLNRTSSSDLVYVIHTSGSLGMPKAVAVSHRNVGAFLRGATSQAFLRPSRLVSHSVNIAFDIAAHTGDFRPFPMGHSLGGTVSKEIVTEMKLWGWEIPFVVMFDTWTVRELDMERVTAFAKVLN
ncbi:putative acyl carrier protein [Teladorsagia circumcincta]|uniref:Putative acyl carrier protein n=1 Tax=Teladorsagia circumcincta TaxID=45464 RepID=A0A2G9UGE5_TELCI|nr:putative acyl carrier protein [Teladorsagia circumcincta]